MLLSLVGKCVNFQNFGSTALSFTWSKSAATITAASGLKFIWLLIGQYSSSGASLALERKQLWSGWNWTLSPFWMVCILQARCAVCSDCGCTARALLGFNPIWTKSVLLAPSRCQVCCYPARFRWWWPAVHPLQDHHQPNLFHFAGQWSSTGEEHTGKSQWVRVSMHAASLTPLLFAVTSPSPRPQRGVEGSGLVCWIPSGMKFDSGVAWSWQFILMINNSALPYWINAENSSKGTNEIIWNGEPRATYTPSWC